MALQVIKEINVDMGHPYIETISAKQYDNGTRNIKVHLFANDTEWIVPDNTNAMVQFRKSDRNGGFYDADEKNNPAISVNGSTVVIVLVPQVLTTPGIVKMDLCFFTSTEERLTTFSWSVDVAESPLSDAIISSNYMSIFNEKISKAANAAKLFGGLTASASSIDFDKSASVDVTGGTVDEETGVATPYNFAFSIPRGVPGPQGPQGPKGDSGDGAVDSVDGLRPDSGDVKLGCVSYSRAQTLTDANRTQFLSNLGIIIKKNTTVSKSLWQSDATYDDYKVRALVSITGCTENHVPDVYFSGSDVLSGNYAPIAEAISGGVYIYAYKIPTASITIPYIRLSL